MLLLSEQSFPVPAAFLRVSIGINMRYFPKYFTSVSNLQGLWYSVVLTSVLIIHKSSKKGDEADKKERRQAYMQHKCERIPVEQKGLHNKDNSSTSLTMLI